MMEQAPTTVRKEYEYEEKKTQSEERNNKAQATTGGKKVKWKDYYVFVGKCAFWLPARLIHFDLSALLLFHWC